MGGTDGVADGPGDKGGSYDGGLLGGAGDVAGDHGETEGLGGPEGEGDVVADEEADLGAHVLVLDGHEDDGSDVGSMLSVDGTLVAEDNSRDDKGAYDEQVLSGLLDQPGGAQEDDDNIEAQYHGQQLRLQDRKLEATDDDVGERTQPAGREGGEDLNGAVAVHLRVAEGLPHLVGAELLVLHTGLVGADSLDHQVLVLLGEALGAHGRVGHPQDDEDTPQHGDDAVGDEKGLPGVDGLVLADQTEAVCEQTADDLLATVHHVPDFVRSIDIKVGDGRTSRSRSLPALLACTTYWTARRRMAGSRPRRYPAGYARRLCG